jgi:DNA-binding GntR family transcriptional regulator
MSSQPLIARRSLHDEVAGLVRDMIIAGDLAAGEKIPEAVLCARFGVSRTPLREALKVLAAEGLVTLTPNRGASVAKITPEEIEELFPIMGVLEALAGEIACAQLTAVDLSRLEKLHATMVAHYGRGDWTAYSKANRIIHETLFEIAGNATLSSLYQQLMVRIHAVRFVARKSPERWREAVEDHERMMVALRARDGAGLAGTLREHLRHKADTMHEALAEAQSAPRKRA